MPLSRAMMGLITNAASVKFNELGTWTDDLLGWDLSDTDSVPLLLLKIPTPAVSFISSEFFVLLHLRDCIIPDPSKLLAHIEAWNVTFLRTIFLSASKGEHLLTHQLLCDSLQHYTKNALIPRIHCWVMPILYLQTFVLIKYVISFAADNHNSFGFLSLFGHLGVFKGWQMLPLIP